jgi:hypothetical protein
LWAPIFSCCESRAQESRGNLVICLASPCTEAGRMSQVACQAPLTGVNASSYKAKRGQGTDFRCVGQC